MKQYDLWLDESGDFEPESQQDRTRTPSLAGGILIPSGAMTDALIRKLALPDGMTIGHATEMSNDEARRIVPPALEGVCSAGGKLVFFENSERIDFFSNRDLYLRVLAAGLAQLVRYLASLEPFRLNIIVAVRLVPSEDNPSVLREITPEEYRRELKSYIAREFADISFILPAEDNIALTVLSARREARLILADYACNARLTVHSGKYEPVRDRLTPLFDDGLLFTVTALSTEARIRARLAAGDTAGALAEYFTTRGTMRKEKMFEEILRQFCSLSYRLQRLHIRSLAEHVRVIAARETDFEHSEFLLRNVIDQFFRHPKVTALNVQQDESLFRLELALADMYLREGDVLHARPIMEELEALIRSMNYRVENLAYLYAYREKKALYEINCMDYSSAVQTMDETIRTMENLISVLDADDLIRSYFSGNSALISEYLGDAYCMKIYAELFLQRQDRGLFEACLKQDTERALSQYSFPGELERNQQYRSKAENEAGNCLTALEWLLKTRYIQPDKSSLIPSCVQYLTEAGNEDPLSRIYYVMYYVEIMENACYLQQDALANAMKAALEQEKNTLHDLIVPEKAVRIPSDTGKQSVVFEDIFTIEKRRRYHPLEIVLWKYGNCLWYAGSRKAALQAWDDAVSVCDENPDYTVLEPVAMAILLDQLHFLVREKQHPAVVRNELDRRCRGFLEKDAIPVKMKQYAERVYAIVNNEKLRAEDLLSAARQIAF